MPDTDHDLSLDAEFAAQPNDAYFKAVFSQPEHAAAFFRSHLPAEVSREVDWASLAVLPGSFVKGTLQQSHSDLVFSAEAAGGPLRLYLLFEHQATLDAAMPLRLLGYVTELLLAHERQHGLPLPPVIPFVLHQGPERWTVPVEFSDLFALPEDAEFRASLRAFLPKFRHGLLDLTRFDPASEEGEQVLRVVLQLMRLAREKRLLDFFHWLTSEIARSLSDDLLKLSLVYAFNVDEQLDLEKITRSLRDDPELKDRAMTLAERLKTEGRQEGRQEGRLEGRQEGRQEGYAQGALNICLRLAARKWGSLPEELAGRLGELPYTALEDLAIDLPGFESLGALEDWLKARK